MAEHEIKVTAEQLITENLDIWTSAIEQKSASGRGSSKKCSLHGIKKLRELILELAVRGKLVPQDPNDEPASVLLERIAAEKAQLVKDKKIKKQKPLPAITDEEKSFELPKGWEWSRVGTAFNSIMSGGTPSKRESSYWGGDIPWASVKDLGKSRNISSTQDFITEAGLHNGSKLANIGDLLICTRMGLGKIAIVDKPLAFNQDLKAVTLSPQINIEFFLNYYSTIKIEGTGTTVAGITQEQLLSYVLALPPLQEQHRIVAKVDELMSLCDALEAQTEASLVAHQTLVETLLGALLLPASTHASGATQGANNSEPLGSPESSFAESWQRVAEHFDTLFTTSASIDTLKQTILQLAVMGKLVEQDPNDEPASVLLERIAAEKAQLIKDKKIKKQKPLPAITDEEKPFELPNGWEWCMLGLLSSDIHYGYTASAKQDCQGVRLLRITDIQNDKVNWSTVPACDISPEKVQSYLLENDDILLARTGGTIGKSYLVENINIDAIFASYLIRVRRIRAMYASYIKVYLGSQLYWGQLYDNAAGTGQPNVNATALKGLLFPLPPLSEQHRIVAKVDELMALCDQLKARLADAQITQLHLTDAIVEQVI